MSNGPLKPKIVKTALSPKIAGNFSYCGQDTCSGFFVPLLLSPYIQFIRRLWWLQPQNISRSWSLFTLSTCYHPSLSYHSLQPGLFQQPPAGLLAAALPNLQTVFNTTPRVTSLKGKSDHGIPLLKMLHASSIQSERTFKNVLNVRT